MLYICPNISSHVKKREALGKKKKHFNSQIGDSGIRILRKVKFANREGGMRLTRIPALNGGKKRYISLGKICPKALRRKKRKEKGARSAWLSRGSCVERSDLLPPSTLGAILFSLRRGRKERGQEIQRRCVKSTNFPTTKTLKLRLLLLLLLKPQRSSSSSSKTVVCNSNSS